GMPAEAAAGDDVTAAAGLAALSVSAAAAGVLDAGMTVVTAVSSAGSVVLPKNAEAVALSATVATAEAADTAVQFEVESAAGVSAAPGMASDDAAEAASLVPSSAAAALPSTQPTRSPRGTLLYQAAITETGPPSPTLLDAEAAAEAAAAIGEDAAEGRLAALEK
ncbi:hypothetical protein Vretifemale_8067, partial [Volvox reticuliferus]